MAANGPATPIVDAILEGIRFPWESGGAVWSQLAGTLDFWQDELLRGGLADGGPLAADVTSSVGTDEDLGKLMSYSCAGCGGACAGHSIDALGSGSSIQVNKGKATPEQMAKYLTTGYWKDQGQIPLSWNTDKSDVITVDLTGVTAEMKVLIRAALEAWEAVADIQFKEVNGNADITFTKNGSGATTTAIYQTNGEMVEATVIVSQSWVNTNGSTLGSYTTQTYIHEIGHALGLGHSGDYNSSSGTTYSNDSWQISVMSYNSQSENPNVDASKAVVMTPMMADIVAAQSLYGKPTGGATAGNTTYGKGATLDTYLDDVFAGKGASMSKNAITIYDESGRDRIDFSTDTSAQRVDLNAGAYSDVYGKIGNLGIAKGTTIEDYVAGSASDSVSGNGAANSLKGMNGNDKLYGRGGGDTLDGGSGNDSVYGGDGNDKLIGGQGNDIMEGDAGKDVFIFNGGRDIVRDFQNDVDTLKIDNAIWGNKAMSIDQLLDYARFSNGMVIFEFDNGARLSVDGISGVEALRNDLVIV